jgi:hypothetical protein
MEGSDAELCLGSGLVAAVVMTECVTDPEKSATLGTIRQRVIR